MQIITGITSEPIQSISIPLPDGSSFTLRLEFSPQQLGWFYDILYSTRTTAFECNGRRLVTSPNILRQFQNIIPFGIGVITQGSVEPTTQTTFSDQIVTLLLLDTADMALIESTIYTGSVARQPFGFTAGAAVYYNQEQTAEFTATCPEGEAGDPVFKSVTVAAGAFSSTISMADANALAYASALAQATEQAESEIVCVIATEWRQVVFQPIYGVYWRVIPDSGSSNDESGFNKTYSGVSSNFSGSALFDSSGSGGYANTQIQFSYETDVSLRFDNGGGPTIEILPAGTGYIDIIKPRVELNSGIAFQNVASFIEIDASITGFRYRFRD